MVEKIEAFKTKDGKIFSSQEKADKYEFVSAMYAIFMQRCYEPREAAEAVWLYRQQIYQLLSPHCSAEAEEAGK